MPGTRAMSTQAFKALQARIGTVSCDAQSSTRTANLTRTARSFTATSTPRNQGRPSRRSCCSMPIGADARTGRRFKRYVTFSQIQPDATDEQAIEAQLAANAKTFGTITNLADTPTARAWQAISRAANDLPQGLSTSGLPRRPGANGSNCGLPAARRHKLREERGGEEAFERFLSRERGMGSFLKPADPRASEAMTP